MPEEGGGAQARRREGTCQARRGTRAKLPGLRRAPEGRPGGHRVTDEAGASLSLISGGETAGRLKLTRTKSGANRVLEDPLHAGRHLGLNPDEPRKHTAGKTSGMTSFQSRTLGWGTLF